MLKLRLQRRGKKNYATYRVVVADQHAPVKGRFIEDVGFYNPHTDEFKVKADRVKERLAKGVQPSDTVHNLLVTAGIVKAEKRTMWRPKKKEEEEGTVVEQVPAEEKVAEEAKEEEKAETK